jgi:hypothetical protein
MSKKGLNRYFNRISLSSPILFYCARYCEANLIELNEPYVEIFPGSDTGLPTAGSGNRATTENCCLTFNFERNHTRLVVQSGAGHLIVGYIGAMIKLLLKGITGQQQASNLLSRWVTIRPSWPNRVQVFAIIICAMTIIDEPRSRFWRMLNSLRPKLMSLNGQWCRPSGGYALMLKWPLNRHRWRQNVYR